MVMALFGRRNHSQQQIANHPTLKPETPMTHALLFSTALSIATGICEEIIFRGMIPAAILYLTHSVLLALFGQAILFGVAHLSPGTTGGENKVIGSIQTLAGIWYGSFYLLAGGDILPCIVAHVLYDSHVLFETWMKANDQMDYTEEAVLQRLTKADENSIRKIKQEVGSSLSAETLAFLRRFFYTFDYDHLGSLSKSDVHRAIAYAFARDEAQPTEDRVNDLFDRLIAYREGILPDNLSQRLMLPEFLRMVLFIRGKPSEAAVEDVFSQNTTPTM
jgi:Type II CAAX prenyl endopeptidase Rce1-like